MQFSPVIQRELTVASRRPETWRLRIMFGVGAVVAFAFAMCLPHVRPAERGQTVLVSLAVCGFILSLFTGAYLTADSVSSEKREGTLGLLFLTPLNGWQIILGKMLTHSLQVGYALVAAFPLFFVPLLFGGVLWSEVTRIVLVLLLTLLLSVACGMFISTISTEARNAVLITVVVLLLLTLVPWLFSFLGRLITPGGFQIQTLQQFSPMTALAFAFETNFRTRGATMLGVPSGAIVYFKSIGVLLACSVGLLGVSGWILPWLWRRSEAGERLIRSTPLLSSAPPQLEAVSSVMQPGSFFRRPRLRLPAWAPSLDQSPLVWLASRDLRETIWLRFVRVAVVVFFACMLFIAVTTRNWEEGYISAFCAAYVCHLFTRIQLALAATRRLHEEKRSGALEALLATPVTDAALIKGHHQSLSLAFRRPLLVLLGLNFFLQLSLILFYNHLHMQHGAGAIFSVFWIGGALLTLADFATIRWLGLCEALRCATHMKAAGRVFGALFAGAWLAFGITFAVAIQFDEDEAAGFFVLWVLACLLYDWLLQQRCRKWIAAGFRSRAAQHA